MSFDGYFIKHLVNQLNKDISGGRIKKVFQTRKDAFVFLVYQKGNTYQLYFDLNPSSSHLSINQDINHTEEKSQFLTTLKKHLENTVITNIKQHLLDRVIILDIQGFDSIFGYLRKKLIFEVMGRSTNLIILDSNDVIIDAYYKQFHPDKRSVLTQAEFSFFPTAKVVLDDTNYDLFLSLDSQKAISDTFMGISKELARFFYENKTVIKPWLLETSPHLYLGDKKYYHAIKITDESNSVPYDSIYTLINDFYKNQDFSKKDQITTLLDTQINKYTLKIQHLNGDLEKNIDYTRYKDIADAIYSSGLDLKTKVVSFDSVLLDEYKTLNDNAQLFYQ
ncbi:MAG TPA: NFACT family protein, partial [Acholeplasma sp.]|nr:NFACT family protein [Acholeplasma sp.]